MRAASKLETTEVTENLADAGCEELQGFLLGKPLPIGKVARQVSLVLETLLLAARDGSTDAVDLITIAGRVHRETGLADAPETTRRSLK
ncbi:hypothetical protein [Pararhizobium sp. PWRC1-1]|uniref:hypothetical protein n=1 Tax=Pararhizobium sp. PWRC1-1 TaxID=2804566 RepID=UPI003CED98DC